MKLTINKIIANDMINYGMDQTNKNSYQFILNSYLNDFDDESKEYILKNIDVINKDIEYSESISDLSISGSGKNRKYNMIFNEDGLLSDFEKLIKYYAEERKVNLSKEKIKNISDDILNSSYFKEKTIDLIYEYNKDGGFELWENIFIQMKK